MERNILKEAVSWFRSRGGVVLENPPGEVHCPLNHSCKRVNTRGCNIVACQGSTIGRAYRSDQAGLPDIQQK